MGVESQVNPAGYRHYMEVTSERLVLRPFQFSDIDHVHVYASDPAVCFFTDWGPNSIEDTRAFVSEAVASGAPLSGTARATYSISTPTRHRSHRRPTQRWH